MQNHFGLFIYELTVLIRDPGARVSMKLVSPTTYSCRHSLTIIWSKAQDATSDNDIHGVICDIIPSRATFTATTVAAVTVEQSEGHICTSALFSLFAPSSKEDKIYLRLPSNWRELYREFSELRKERVDAHDRVSVRHFRTIVQDQLETEKSDGVVLTSRFKMRNQTAANPNALEHSQNMSKTHDERLIDTWNQKTAMPSYQRMLVQRKDLPVFGFRSSILSTIDSHQVTIICGETGCGKSTQIPSFILEHQMSQGKLCKILCTEPRRISAISLAQRVSEELGESKNDLGTLRSLVGYAIRLETKSSAQTRLVYATVGVVLRMLESSGRLEEVTHLIIDEVHERR
jgi:ATP-dependent RNA helicase DHX29